tara:strand:+ start:35 stop:973 length:939 start_codon:yes stop_codon:yes gene_type:complete
MTVRIPVKLNGDNNIIDCTAAEIIALSTEAIRQYALDPSVDLTVGSGNRGNLSDTRLKAGAAGSDSTNFDTSGELADVAVVTVNYNKIIQTIESVAKYANSTYSFPVYQNGDGNLQAMTEADMFDTFIAPAVLRMCTTSTGTDQAGTYTITASANAATGETAVSSTAVFTDTRANAGAYSAAGLPETLDQATTITNYFLHIIDGASAATIVRPLAILSSNTLKLGMYPLTLLRDMLKGSIRFAAAGGVSGSTITYAHATTGTTSARGTAMLDTRLDGSTRLTLQVGDDYRAQEVPSGDAGTISTHRLYIRRS